MNEQQEFVHLICPYCGTRQTQYLKRFTSPQVILCDCENAPGCDRYFAVTLRMKPVVEYYAMNETAEAKDQTGLRLKEALDDIKRHRIPSPLEAS